MKLFLSTCLGAVLFAGAASAATIRDFDHLALAPDGSKIVDVEDNDPGNLPDEPHGALVVRDAGGKILAQYDPCKACQYSDTAWSPRSDAFAFVGFDRAAGKATVYVAAKGSPRVVTTVSGVVNTLRWSPDGAARLGDAGHAGRALRAPARWKRARRWSAG